MAENIRLVGSVDEFGTVRARVATENPKNPEVARCLRSAVAEVWFLPLRRGEHPAEREAGKEFRLAFKLKPALVDPATLPKACERGARESCAASLLARGDGRRASQIYAELLNSESNSGRACSWHAGGARAAILMAPWYDHRVSEALEKLRQHIEGRGRHANTGTCVAKLASLVGELALLKHNAAMKLGQHGELSDVVDLYDWLLAVAPQHQGSCDFRHYRGEALWQSAESETDAVRAKELWKQAEEARANLCTK